MSRFVLFISALVEVSVGLAFLVTPGLFCWMLVGMRPESALEFLLCRLLGAALVTIGVACLWAARSDQSRSVNIAAFLYHLMAALVLGLPWKDGSLAGLLLPLAVYLHSLMTVALLPGVFRSRRPTDSD